MSVLYQNVYIQHYNIFSVPYTSTDGTNVLHGMNKESSGDQDGLNQASIRSDGKTKHCPVLLWIKAKTLSVILQN